MPLSGTGKKTTLPPKASPVPTPATSETTGAGEAERLRASRRKGRQSLILTEPCHVLHNVP